MIILKNILIKSVNFNGIETSNIIILESNLIKNTPTFLENTSLRSLNNYNDVMFIKNYHYIDMSGKIYIKNDLYTTGEINKFFRFLDSILKNRTYLDEHLITAFKLCNYFGCESIRKIILEMYKYKCFTNETKVSLYAIYKELNKTDRVENYVGSNIFNAIDCKALLQMGYDIEDISINAIPNLLVLLKTDDIPNNFSHGLKNVLSFINIIDDCYIIGSFITDYVRPMIKENYHNIYNNVSNITIISLLDTKKIKDMFHQKFNCKVDQINIKIPDVPVIYIGMLNNTWRTVGNYIYNMKWSGGYENLPKFVYYKGNIYISAQYIYILKDTTKVNFDMYLY
jgi:hypothetical protein